MYGMGERPETAARWAQADASAPGTAGFRQGQAGLRSWIDQRVEEAIASGQLDPMDRAGLQSLLATLGVTDEKGGGKYIFNEIMNRGGAAKYAAMPTRTAQAPLGFPGAQEMGRQAVMSRYGDRAPMSQRPASYAAGSFAEAPAWSEWGNWR